MNRFWFLSVRVIKRTMTGLSCTVPTKEEYDLQRVLLVSKTTRFEMEQQQHFQTSETDFHELLVNRDSEFLLKAHEEHKKFEREVICSLEKLNVDVKIVDRYERPVDLINWADTIISIGGDGTYLMAANKIVDQSKPVIGFNSCPETSTGYLCLPKSCSRDIFKTLSDIKKRKFAWAYRTRIQVSLTGKNIDKQWVSVHDKASKARKSPTPNDSATHGFTEEETFDVPHLALNEVFIAESVPASVSYLDVALDDGELTTTKNSGICICTGSGSSSWNFTMNRISHEVVQKLFKISGYTNVNIDQIVESYNNSLRYPPDDERMDFTIRDLIPMSMWPKMPNLPSKGFATKILIRSQCRDGSLVIDGGCSYHFNSGTSAVLKTDRKNALKTINLIGTNFCDE